MSEVAHSRGVQADTVRMDRRELEALHQRLLQLTRLREPERVGATATELLDALRKLSEDVSAARDAAVCELYDGGYSLHEIARRIGVTRGRVFQIIQRNRGVGRVPGVPMS